MFVPPLLPASVVFEGANLTRTVECTCGKQQQVNGKWCAWSHRAGSDDYGWFLMCTPQCYLKNVSAGGMQ